MKKIFLLIVISFFIAGIAPVWSEPSEWKEDKQTHFIVYYKNAPKDFIDEVERAAEEYYKEICDNLGFTRYKNWLSEDRAKIYIFDDGEDYKKEAQAIPWSHGLTFSQAKIIRTFPSAHGFFDSVLPHELGHIILREFIGPDAEVPLWFDEGVAMYQEKAKRWGSHKIVKEALKNKMFIPLKDLTGFNLSQQPNNFGYVELFYAESASVVNYLINEQGHQRFVRFCRKLQDNQPFDETLESVYGRFKGIDDLNKTWMNYIEDL